MDFCNCSDLKELMNINSKEVNYAIIRLITSQLVHGIHDMMDSLVIHRDIKLRNMMLHFPNV
jgi:serine/threonine protein kinase